jgi:hypothetical protein
VCRALEHFTILLKQQQQQIIGETEFVRRSTETGHRYFMALDVGEYLDPSRRGSIARFMNHSCEPNCTMEVRNNSKNNSARTTPPLQLLPSLIDRRFVTFDLTFSSI